MLEINLFDKNGIDNDVLTGKLKQYENIKFVYNQTNFNGITIFTDNFIFSDIVDQIKSKIKIAWLVEPKVFNNQIYLVSQIQDKFDYIFTFDSELLSLGDKYKLVPTGNCWIPKNSVKIHTKTKLASCIISEKKFLPGHHLRHSIYQTYKDSGIDFYGKLVRPIPTKDIGLNNYMFSLAIENNITDNYFTEKLIDCLATGTIPVYYGPKNIGNFFDEKGILSFTNSIELHKILQKLDRDLYLNLYNSVVNNFNLCKKYYYIEDWIYNNILQGINV